MILESNLWKSSAKESFQAVELTENLSTDIVIIGAGYTGLSAALETAQLGASVAVLEAKTVGFGGSGRNVGLVNAGLWLPPEKVVATMGKQAGNRLNSVLADAPDAVFDLIEKHGIDCVPVRNGTLHCAHSTSGYAQLVDRHRQQKNLGAPVTLLSAHQAQEWIGSPHIYGALHDARAGTIQPLSYALGLARAAKCAGAKIFENTCVKSIKQTGLGWELTIPNGIVTAKKLLIATNAYHNATTMGLGVPNISKVNFFQMSTDRLPDSVAKNILPRREGCWDTRTIMTSFRLDGQNRFIIGGMGQPEKFGIHQSWARRAMANLFPQLRDAPMRTCWSGRIAMTANHIPRLLRIGASGYTMFGYSGRGIGPGTVMGRSIAKTLMTGDENGLPLEPVDAFNEYVPWLKTIFFETGARVYHSVSGRQSHNK